LGLFIFQLLELGSRPYYYQAWRRKSEAHIYPPGDNGLEGHGVFARKGLFHLLTVINDFETSSYNTFPVYMTGKKSDYEGKKIKNEGLTFEKT